MLIALGAFAPLILYIKNQGVIIPFMSREPIRFFEVLLGRKSVMDELGWRVAMQGTV